MKKFSEEETNAYEAGLEEGRKQIFIDEICTLHIQPLIDLAKANGLKSLNFARMSFEFWDRPEPVAQPIQDDTKQTVPLTGDEMPSDERMLLWSTSAYDEMEQALKDAQGPEIVP